jgi:carboxymethylenebutenolidase
VADQEQAELLAGAAKARLYIGVAEVDRRHTPEVTRRLEAALTRAGVAHQIELYEGASHGFAVSDLPPYQTAAAERHWERLLALLGSTLGPDPAG